MDPEYDKRQHMHSTKGRVFSGAFVVVVGLLLLAKQMGFELPSWLFTWEMLVIAIGVYTGIKHDFKHIGWLIPVAIGSVFLLSDIFPGTKLENYFWPALVIFIGIGMISSAGRRKERWKEWREKCQSYPGEEVSDNMLDTVSVFGGIKKNIISKDFKGGEVTCVFGGAEINLSQADLHGNVVLEVTQVFGGTRLIIPANWEIQSEVVAVLGSIEDKRPVSGPFSGEKKTLILKGVTLLGGIDIKSF